MFTAQLYSILDVLNFRRQYMSKYSQNFHIAIDLFEAFDTIDYEIVFDEI